MFEGRHRCNFHHRMPPPLYSHQQTAIVGGCIAELEWGKNDFDAGKFFSFAYNICYNIYGVIDD